jgi:hypothetical protein
MFNVSLTHYTLILNNSSVQNTDFIIAILLFLLFITAVMSKHIIIIICCSMSAIWLASTSTYHLHPESLQSFSVAVSEVVSSKANNAQNIMSDGLFGHRDSESRGMVLDTCIENEYEEILSMYDRASFNQVNNRTNRCNNN